MDRIENDTANNCSFPWERLYLATIGGYTNSPTDTRPTILLLLRVFLAMGTCFPNRCLAMKGGGYTLRSLCLATTGGIDIETHRLMGFIYEVRRWDKLRGDSQTHRQHGDHISLLLFFQNKERRLKIELILCCLIIKLLEDWSWNKSWI
jgi:hypothetical protein